MPEVVDAARRRREPTPRFRGSSADDAGGMKHVAGKEKVIAVVGVSEEDTAHLRLLLRKAADHLKFRWRWGAEDGADLVVIDPKTFAGQLARNRFGATGARCALLLDAGKVENGVLQFHRPLKITAFLEVLRQIEGNVMDGLELVPLSDDFYFGEMGEFRPEHSLDELDAFADDPDESHTVVVLRGGADAGDGLAEVLKHDPADDKPRVTVPVHLDSDTAIEATGAPSARSEWRRGDEQDEMRPGSGSMRLDPDAAPPFKRAAEEAPKAEPLVAYLAQPLLGGPSRLVYDNAPALVLDPKHQSFHSASGLHALEVYCRAPILRSAWTSITSAEMAHLQEAAPARPYEYLVWLSTLVRSEGRLASNLDPGGAYRLTRLIDLGDDYPWVRSISRHMQQPLRLHEIAAAANAEMGEVFNVVNAYDAIGCISWTPRQPRNAVPEDKKGLLGKLKLPFGRK